MVRNTAELSQEIMRHPLRLVRKLYTSCQLTKCKDETDRAFSLSKFKYDAFSLTDRHNVISLYNIFGKIDWKGIK